MASDFAGMIPGMTYSGSHSAQNAVVAKIKAAKQADPNEPVILVGHSWGADSVIEVAEALAECNIWIDLLVQVDSVGVGDEKLPRNVATGVNIWSTSRVGMNGASNVQGSTNIGIDNSTHTDIDEKNDTGTSSQAGYVGKNAYQIVKDFIAAVPANACTAPVPPNNCPADAQGSFDALEEILFDKLDEAEFCYSDGGPIEQYIDDQEGLMNQIDNAWCDSMELKAFLPPFAGFVSDGGGVLQCQAGEDARPFDDQLHLVVPTVPTVSEWGLLLLLLGGLSMGTILIGQRSPSAIAA
ncbi:MAG: hypothetical protein HOP29_10105 [Phycisphaerales bacterium]|nr:hypothetical protein [Phycisphaerales bacterium]